MNSATTETAVTNSPRRVFVPLFLFLIAGLIYVSDQLSKNWVELNLPYGESVPVLGEFLQWHFVRNPGAAFSMASGQTWIFTILATVVTGVILWQIRRLRSLPWAFFLGLLLGGVLGNLTDRLFRDPGFPEGHVVDFVYTPWMMPAIYNVADIGIVGGMIVFVVLTLFGFKIEGGRHPNKAQREAAEAAEAAERAADTEGSGPKQDSTEAVGAGAHTSVPSDTDEETAVNPGTSGRSEEE